MCAWWVVWQTGRECFVGFIEVAWISCPKCLWIFLLFKLSSSQNYSAYVRYIDTKGCPRIKIFSIWWIGFFLKRSKRKPCCHFISHQWMWSLDVWSKHLKITQLLHSLVFFLPLLDCQLKGIAWKRSHPSKLTCFYFSKYYYCGFCYVIS